MGKTTIFDFMKAYKAALKKKDGKKKYYWGLHGRHFRRAHPADR